MIGLLIAAQFATFAGKDPITLEPQALFAVHDAGNMLAFYCRPSKNEIEARFVPSGYGGAAQYVPLWTPRADSRFGEQPQAEKDSWSFASTYLAYVSKSPLSDVKGTAEFIDQLCAIANSTFDMRLCQTQYERSRCTTS
jgi:hypothetical protein